MRKIDLHQIGHRIYVELEVPAEVHGTWQEVCSVCALQDKERLCREVDCLVNDSNRGVYCLERNVKKTFAALIALRLEGKRHA